MKLNREQEAAVMWPLVREAMQHPELWAQIASKSSVDALTIINEYAGTRFRTSDDASEVIAALTERLAELRASRARPERVLMSRRKSGGLWAQHFAPISGELRKDPDYEYAVFVRLRGSDGSEQ